MAHRWYGYGRWDARYWFIGPEPGQAPREGNDLRRRCEAWTKLGRRELIDCKDHHLRFGWEDWHREAPPPPRLQQTWKQLIRLLLATRSRRPPDIGDIRSYQQKSWGMKGGETCVIELSCLAANNLGMERPRSIFRNERIGVIRRRILDHKPTFVVMYGLGNRSHWEAIMGKAFPPDNILKVGPTVFAFTKHPVSFGLPNSYWLQLAKKLRHKLQQ